MHHWCIKMHQLPVSEKWEGRAAIEVISYTSDLTDLCGTDIWSGYRFQDGKKSTSTA